MSRCRALVVVLSLALMLPSAAFAQGAGDEQYQDPFGDDQTQQGTPRTQAAQDDGLTDEPPVDDGEAPAPPTGEAPEEPAEEPAQQQPQEESALPNTGHDPRVLALFGLVFLLVGVGLRLRTIDPDAY
jgi:LPXTG-motif cell wall-anchored protein